MAVTDAVEAKAISGQEKAAALLLSLGVDRSSAVLKHLGDAELEQVLLTLSETPQIPPQVQRQVLQETYALTQGGGGTASGGLSYARQLLARAFQPERGEEMLERIMTHKRSDALGLLRRADPAQVAELLREEHPQAVAFVLSRLGPHVAARVLSQMPSEMQADVTLRLARLEGIAPQVFEAVENSLSRKLAGTLGDQDVSVSAGVTFLVKVLNLVDRGVQKSILEVLDEWQPELAEEIRANLFTFDDLVKLDDRSIQRILRDVNKQDLVLALKGAPEQVRELIFRNMSERARENLMEELELLGPQLAKNVYAAQRRIVDTVRALEESEEIIIAGGGEADEIIY